MFLLFLMSGGERWPDAISPSGKSATTFHERESNIMYKLRQGLCPVHAISMEQFEAETQKQ